MITKTQAVTNLAQKLRDQFLGDYIVLTSVRASEVVPLAVKSRNKYLEETILDIVIAKMDYSPLLVIDITPEHQSIAERESDLQVERSMLMDAKIPIVHFSTTDDPSPRELELIITDAKDNHALMLAEKIDSISNHIEPSQEDPSSYDKKLLQAKVAGRFFYLKVMVTLIIGFIIFLWTQDYVSKISKKSDINFSLDSNSSDKVVTDTLTENVKSNLPSYQALKKPPANVCDRNPPENGTIVAISSNVNGTGKAYWTFENQTELHAVASIYDREKDIVDLYLKPKSKFTFTTIPAYYSYSISTTSKWCNFKTTKNPSSFNGNTVSKGSIYSGLKANILAITVIQSINNNLNTDTSIHEVQ